MSEISVGDRVSWAGVQDPRCAPGFTGTVLAAAHHDPDSLKVHWAERGTYTWERRKNLDWGPPDMAVLAK